MQGALLLVPSRHHVTDVQNNRAQHVGEIAAYGLAHLNRATVGSDHIYTQRQFPGGRSEFHQEVSAVGHAGRERHELNRPDGSPVLSKTAFRQLRFGQAVNGLSLPTPE